jgi:glycosyltransferase involved in cell wall biosynthesis
MRIFVASWFFPPATSSEGIVSYKLLRNSRHSYDVCSADSSLWSYQQTLPLDANNITSFPIKTDDLDVWVDEAVALFTKRHAETPYDAIMTRSMPPESVFVAQKIREIYPDIPWIASLADPVGKAPYHIQGWVLESSELSEQDKTDFQTALKSGCSAWKNNNAEGVRLMCELKDIEDYAIAHADALVFPCDTLRRYVLGTRQCNNAFSIPHSFDTTLYQTPDVAASERTTLTFVGHSDVVRSLEPIVRAVNRLRIQDEQTLDRLNIRFVGNITEQVRSLVYNYFLHDCITIEPSVDYLTSLKIMQESDWLIHVDAKFDFLAETGGSIYFAGKLADYMGTDRPILALTGHYSPAGEIVRRAGGLCFEQQDSSGIAEALGDIVAGRLVVPIDRAYRDGYDAVAVAQKHDQMIEDVVDQKSQIPVRSFWPVVVDQNPGAEKILSICVPAYNVECYLDRCLFSLISSEVADKFEIIVVNDGSTDSSREIALAYQEHYPTIVRLIDKENGGHGSTINVALEHATGMYFRVIDGDDWVDAINLAKLVNSIFEKELFADLVATNYHQVYGEDGRMVPWMKVSGVENYHLFDFANNDFTMEYFTLASVMVKTSILKQANFKIQEHTYYADVEYILFPIPYVKTVMFTPEFVYRYAVGNAEQSINPDVFAKRYDHHDRVVRRMLTYFEDMRSSMSPGQIAYVESLFERHLLKSHYTLSLLWDLDKTRGFARAKDFDAFLKAASPHLYDECRKRYRAIREARRWDFNPKRARRIFSLESGSHASTFRDKLRRIAEKTERSSVGNRLVYNRFTKHIVDKLFP